VGILNDAAREAVTGGHLAHLTTVSRDGGPHATIVWVGLDGDELVTAHLAAYQKVRNVERDGRVSVTVVTGRRDPSGLDEYLVVYGTARVQEGGAPELLQELAYRYIGPGVRFPPMDDPPPGYVLRITPERVAGVGPWRTAAG
jgi:PPOX class probable F420-dependent enzyme